MVSMGDVFPGTVSMYEKVVWVLLGEVVDRLLLRRGRRGYFE